ncbi:hypothetical protein LCGC14_0373470 [marine sediment metagenome]|uniref:Uncharacterized protein n=1 Tax=marine sediment metagenome TaxID=412755 RepID=A0A0F9TMI5_9ZZZZ
MSGIIAYQGIVKMEKSTWDTVWGMYAQFSMEQGKDELGSANPLKRFTGMRKGRVGTIFAAVFNSPTTGITLDDEVMLKGWSDGTTGWKVTFWFNGEAANEHPFMRFDKGAEFALVLVELDDDNSAIDQVKRDRVETAPKTARKRTLSNYAAMLCREPMFMRYLGDTYGLSCDPKFADEVATNWMREFLGIKSRSELDTDQFVAGQFHADIRGPYRKWHAGVAG